MRFLLLLALAGTANASTLSYDFYEAHSNQAIGRLELARLPAKHTEVVSLTFTPAGEEMFGFGPVYLGGFDVSFGGGLLDDGAGGLTADSCCSPIADFTPPPPAEEFVLGVFFNDGAPEDDFMRAVLNNQPRPVLALGEWRIIPEPGGLALLLAFAGICLVRRMTRSEKQ